MKKQVIGMLSIGAVVSLVFLPAFDILWYGNPFQRIWQAIYELQTRVDELNATAIELQTQVNSIEEKQNQVRWIRFYEPDETMIDQYVWKDVAVFVWAPGNATNNAIIDGRCYFRYLTPTHGMAFRILVNGFDVCSTTPPDRTEYQQTVAYLFYGLPEPNQSTYTITFQCRSVGPSYVKDINVLIEVMDGLPVTFP